MTPNIRNRQLTRLLTLACRLLQGDRIRPRDAARELGVSERTVWRDYALLSGLLPVVSEGGTFKIVEVK